MAKMTNSGAGPADFATDRQAVVVPGAIERPLTHGDIAIVAVGYQPHKTTWIDQRFAVHAVGLVVSGRGHYRLRGGGEQPPVATSSASLPRPSAPLTPLAPPTPSTPAAAAPPTPIEPGAMFTVFPGPVFSYGATPEPAWEEYYFCAVGAGTRRWIDFGWFPVDGSVHRLANVAVAVELYRELIRIQRRGDPGDGDRAVNLAERLLIEMVHGREASRRPRDTDGTLQAVLSDLRQNFARPVDFTAVASDHAMSYSSLRQRIRQATGLPPAQYLIHLRCAKAQALLSDTDLSIKEIGAAVGIADPFAFSRTFKKCIGLAPAQYRRDTAPWARNGARNAVHGQARKRAQTTQVPPARSPAMEDSRGE